MTGHLIRDRHIGVRARPKSARACRCCNVRSATGPAGAEVKMVRSPGARSGGRSRAQASGADDPVLTSKITMPSVPAWAVGRPQIDKLIADGARGPLTTVTGPPGSGKTMAIASWAAVHSDPATLVWITLDDYDNRPEVFWSYVVAALRRAGIAAPRLPSIAGRGAVVDHVFLLRLPPWLAPHDPP